MTNNSRVIHATRGYSMKFGQVQKRIVENCCFVWVKYGETFRDATILEAANMRKEQAKTAEPIPFAEIPGLRYEPSVQNQASTCLSYAILKQANQFCAEHA